ncbi:hypothetical protein LCGC14_0694430 [marine sediment metagenome]|uniref:Uncharacterized protein n=1 Tax=marine sediment metagenome TaxID=412755 RepID=A0A0F9T5X6_9ZZZZ
MKGNIIINVITEEQEEEIIKRAVKHLMVCSKEPYVFEQSTLEGCFRGCIRDTVKKLCEQ